MTELPMAKTEMASHVVKKIEVIKSLLSPGIEPMQFIAATMMEANTLAHQLEPEQMNDPRTIASFVKAAVNAAVVGLIPGTALGHCYFLPFTMNRGKRSEYVMIQYVPGYRGYLELAFASNFLVQCDPEVVLAGEPIRRWHDNKPRIQHDIPTPRGQECTRESLVGAYCTYQTRHDGDGITYCEREEILKVDTKRNVWKSDFKAQVLKTPIRRSSKLWHLTRQLAYAVDMDERAERNEPQPSLVPDDHIADDVIDLDALEEGETHETDDNG